MKMDKVAGSGNDEFYTPEYAIAPLYKYLAPPPAGMWWPVVTEDSRIRKAVPPARVYRNCYAHLQRAGFL